MTNPSSIWQTAQLGDHVDLLTGYPFKSQQYTEKQEDVRLLRGDNVAQGTLRWNGVKRWDAHEYHRLAQFHLQKGDVILAMDRPWISAGLKHAWIRQEDLPTLLVQRVSRLRGVNGLLTDYARFLIGSPAFTNHVLSIITGVNVPHISPRDIKAFRFQLPPLPTQRRIASVLSAYDDLIENNTRRIAILEEMAQRLYEEWFVQFRFPGHEEAKMEGELPVGWHLVPMKDLCRLKSGFAFKSSTFSKSSRYNLVTIKNVQDGYFLPDCDSQLDEVPNNMPDYCFIETGAILLSLTGNVGRVCIVYGGDFILNQRVSKIVAAKKLHEPYLYFMFRDTSFRKTLENLATGVAQQNLSPVKAEQLPILSPPQGIMSKFCEFASPILQQGTALRKKNANLRAQRDLLLPKLISGEIDVSNLLLPGAEDQAA